MTDFGVGGVEYEELYYLKISSHLQNCCTPYCEIENLSETDMDFQIKFKKADQFLNTNVCCFCDYNYKYYL